MGIGWVFGGLIALAIAAEIVHLVWRWKRWRRFKKSEQLTAAKLGKPPDRIDATPDRPIPFGYKMAWLAIPASDPAKVAQSLPVENLESANWLTGRWAAYEGRLFVTPAVRGWVFVVCFKLPSLGEHNHEQAFKNLMQSLSREFGEAQHFATHRVVEFHAWARYANGAEVRAFAYLGERGETLVDRGARTPGEVELNYNYFDERSPLIDTEVYWGRGDLTYPDEQQVMEVAGKWSVNPTLLDESCAEPGTGWVGDCVASVIQST
jgi:hypothetical protein